MSHTLRLRFDAEQPQPGSIVGVLADGIASTSAPLPAVSRDGLYRVPLAIQYGATITVRILHAGVVGAESNAQVFEGCYWERTGDAVVGGADWSQYLLSVGAGTATAAEQESFVRAFGMRCP